MSAQTPAFPSHGSMGEVIHEGMTLRDYFAAKALSTASAYSSANVDTWSAEDFAQHAYALADAMLAEREKGGGA